LMAGDLFDKGTLNGCEERNIAQMTHSKGRQRNESDDVVQMG
jgi:hypothetical protein